MTGPDAEQEPVPELSFSSAGYTAIDFDRNPEIARAWEALYDEREPTEADLTIAEAAAATGASERTLRRKLSADALPGARMAGGRWLIPEGALRAAGYTLAEPTPEADRAEPTASAGWLLERAELLARAEAAELLAADQRAAADDERHQRELAEQRAGAAERAEALALERARNAEAAADRAQMILANLSQTVRELTARSEPETVIVESTPQRRRWWQRSK